MSGPPPLLVAVLALLGGLALTWTQAWRALLALWPASVRVEAEEPAEVVTLPGPLEASWATLAALGFRLLGSHSERPYFRPARLLYDAVDASHTTFASLWLVDGVAHVSFFSPAAGGGVLTSDERRAGREVPGRYLAGGLEGAAPERLLRAHERRLADLRVPLALEPSLEGRVAAARAWYAGAGAAELRARHVIGALWTVGGAALAVRAALWLVDAAPP